MDTKKKEKKSSVVCDAKNCVYNCPDERRCSAEKIRVGTEHATNSAETICATFVSGRQ
ncbi:MAG: DUF1540 domain-containing protein [Clostridia bacterium]|nr:DUF1540 domain-containing protein [Clostridia bacterium]